MSFRDQGITAAPSSLETEGFILRPIVASDAQLDYEAVMESKDLLRQWSQSTWPEDDFTVEANREDMVKMERRHASGEAFGYTMMNLDQGAWIARSWTHWSAGRACTPIRDQAARRAG